MTNKKIRITTLAWLASCLLAPSTVAAAPIEYTIHFTVLQGTGDTPVGSFTYDPDAPLFSDFLVSWNGVTLNMTGAANMPFAFSGCPATASGAALGFEIMSGASGCPTEQLWYGLAFAALPLTIFDFFSSDDPMTEMVSSMQPVQEFLSSYPGSGADQSMAGTFTIEPLTNAEVPEPGSLVLLGTGLLAVVARMRRRGTS